MNELNHANLVTITWVIALNALARATVRNAEMAIQKYLVLALIHLGEY